MAGRYKGAVRQLSFQVEEKRKVLKKQRSSEDGRRSAFERRAAFESRRSSEIWSDDDKPVEVIATKCGQPKPVAMRPPRSPLVPDQRALTASRQEIAKRLRQAWARSHNSNIEIYLTHDGDSDGDPTVTPRTQVDCPTPDIQIDSSNSCSAPDSNKENRISNSQVLEINAHCKELVNGSYSTDCSPYMSEEEDAPAEPTKMEPKKEEIPPGKVTPCRLSAEERRMNFRNGFKRAISTSISSTPPQTPTARRSPVIQQRPESRSSSTKQGKKPPSPQVRNVVVY